MAFTSEQLAAMEAAAAQGLSHVQLGDKVIHYQSLPDLLKAVQVARSDIAAAAGQARTARRYVEFNRG